ncbi:MAG: hypothetical protein AAF206_20660 [Bacteroidota bacterium]
MRKLFFLSLTTMLLAACSGQKSAAPEETSGATSELPAHVKRNLELGRMGDSTSFPFVYTGEGRSNLFEAYTMKFRLEYEAPMVPMTNDVLPWIKEENYSELNGVFMTYMRNGREIAVSSPSVRVEYVSKKNPYCSSIDSIYTWLDHNFIERRQGRVMKNVYSLKTKSGKKAEMKEYSLPDSPQQAGRYVAYAYIDYDQDYLIGFALTCLDQTDFDINKPLFEGIVKSFAFL